MLEPGWATVADTNHYFLAGLATTVTLGGYLTAQ